MRNLVPPDFEIPQVLETEKFRLRMLTIHDVVKDYDAVMTSVEHLQGVFGRRDEWPMDLTLEEDLVDTAEEQSEAEELVDGLVEIFRDEAADLLSRYYDALDSWRSEPEKQEARNELKRIFHTIKGSARITGFSNIGDVAHNTESLVELSEQAENDVG